MPDEIQLPEFAEELEPDPEPRDRPTPAADYIAACKLEKAGAALFPSFDDEEIEARTNMIREIAEKTGLAVYKIEETIYDAAQKLKGVQIPPR